MKNIEVLSTPAAIGLRLNSDRGINLYHAESFNFFPLSHLGKNFSQVYFKTESKNVFQIANIFDGWYLRNKKDTTKHKINNLELKSISLDEGFFWETDKGTSIVTDIVALTIPVHLSTIGIEEIRFVRDFHRVHKS